MKKPALFFAALASMSLFAMATNAKELTSGPDVLEPIGWAVSMDGQVYWIGPDKDIPDVKAAAVRECNKATHEACTGALTVSRDAVVAAIHCRRGGKADSDESFLGVSLNSDEKEAKDNAMDQASNRSFDPAQECDLVDSWNVSDEKTE